MKRFLALATLALSLVSTAAFADTRGDFYSSPDVYGSVTVNKGLPNGHVISFDIPVHASLLGQKGAATPVAAYGRVMATSIGYVKPGAQAAAAPSWGVAKTPYAN